MVSNDEIKKMLEAKRSGITNEESNKKVTSKKKLEELDDAKEKVLNGFYSGMIENETRRRNSLQNPLDRLCPICGAKNYLTSSFCLECGGKLTELTELSIENSKNNKNNHLNKLVENRDDDEIIMQIEGQNGKIRSYEGYLKKYSLIIGESRVFRSKMDYSEITFDDITNISLENFVNSKLRKNILIKTRKNETMKVVGVKIEAAKSFAYALHQILSGDNEIINKKQLNQIKTEDIPIFAGDINQRYIDYGKIFVRADSSLFSKTATMNDANARLREEAIKLGANAIINTYYERSSLTSWRGVKAEGNAVFIDTNERKCPFCAEIIKKEAIKCKHCGSNLNESTNK